MVDEGFREFARARLGALSQLAYLLTGDHHAAEDLLQDALVVVARRWRRVSEADNPTAYVRQILYHEFVSRWRRERYRRHELSSEQVPETNAGEKDHHVDAAGDELLGEIDGCPVLAEGDFAQARAHERLAAEFFDQAGDFFLLAAFQRCDAQAK